MKKQSTSIGQSAEAAVCNRLQSQGYKILAQNWRNRYCEIDIVASKESTVYFVEVKYRSSDRQGSGLDYITTKKLRQMQFAAEVWLAENNWAGDSQLLAAEVSGNKFQHINIVEL